MTTALLNVLKTFNVLIFVHVETALWVHASMQVDTAAAPADDDTSCGMTVNSADVIMIKIS